MAIEAQLADGRILEFPDGTDPGIIQSTVKRVLASSAAPQQSTIGSELARGAKQLFSSTRTGVEALGASPEEAAQRGMARSQEIAAAAGEGPSFEAVKRAYQEKGILPAGGEALSQIPRALAGQGAQLGALAAGAKAGSTAGALFGPAGRIVGGVVGAGATLLPQFFGANVERQASEQTEAGKPIRIDRAKAAGAAAGQAALEGAGTAFTLGKGVVKGVLGIADDAALVTAKAQQELVRTAQRSLASTAGRGAARGTAEIPVEVAQQVLERAQAGLDLTSPEALSEYGEAAYQAGLIGGAIGGVSNVAARGQARSQVAAQEAQKRAEEAQKRAAEIAAQPAQAAPETAEPDQITAGKIEGPTPAAETPAAPEAAPQAPAPAEVAPAPEVEPAETAEPTDVVEPSTVEMRPGALTMQDVEDVGIPLSTTRGWFAENVVGKTREELQALVAANPALLEGKTKRAKVLRELLAPQAAPFVEEKPDDPTRTQTPAVEQGPEPRAGEPSVGVPVEPAAPVVPEPGAGVAGPTGEPEAPVGLGLVPAGQPSGPGAEAKVAEPAPVVGQDLQDRLQAIINDPTASKRAKQTAFTALDSLQDPKLNETGEDRRQNEAYAAKALQTAEQQRAIKDAAAPEPEVSPRVQGFMSRYPTTEVVYNDGQYILMRAPNEETGEALYFPMLADGTYAQTASGPVSLQRLLNHPPVVFSAEQLADFRKALDQVTAEDAKTPEGPFTGAKSNVVGGESMDPRYVGYLTDLMKSIGLGDVRVFLYHGKDVRGRAKELNIHSSYYPIMARAIPTENQRGATVQIGPEGKDFMLFVNDNMSEAETLETIAHELGHMIEKISFNNAPTDVQNAIRDEYDTWLAQSKDVTLRELAHSLRNRNMASYMDTSAKADTKVSSMSARERKYWQGFDEWFADNVSRWATTADKPLTITEKFFSKVGQMMRDLVAAVTGRKYPPAKTVKEFMDSMGPGSADMWMAGQSTSGQAIQPLQTASAKDEALRKWFGDSKVVDKGGKPLVLYTGTSKDTDFDKFKVPKNGAWFSTDPQVASQYAVENDSKDFKYDPDTRNYREVNTAARVMPVYVRIENPYTLTAEESQTLFKAANYKKAQSVIFDRARARGFDGVDMGDGVWVVLKDSNQIKSAIGNKGTYSLKSPKLSEAVSYSTEQLVESMGPLDPVQDTGLMSLIPGLKAGLSPAEPDYATKFRTQTADAAATIQHRLESTFDGAVRNSLGKLNPMGLYRQAQDYTKLLLEFFQVGGLVKDKATGLWVVSEKEGVRPPAEVYKLIDAWGEKNGYDREKATQIASRVLEGVRLNEMRKANQTQGANFALHMKDAEINQLLAEYNADPDLQAMSKLMDEARLAMVDNMVAVGRLSAEQGAEWKQVVGYVPFDRIDEFSENYSKIKKISNKGIAQVGKLPELIGSETRMVGNVFDNYLNTLGWMVGQTMKTDGTVQTLRSLQSIQQAKYLGGSTQGKANTVGAYVGGELKYWELPSKYDVMAFKDLNPPKAGWLRNMGKFSHVLRRAVTSLPPFALKQVTDDVQRAIMTSGVRNPGALLRMSLTNFGGLAWAELRGIQHPTVKEFGRLGLTGEYDFEAGKPATSLLKDLGYKKRTKFQTLMHRLDGITRASDLAVRKAIYDQTLKETNDQLLAQTRAREFINFRRRGASDFVGAMVTTIPFFNAYIQGMDVLYRAASGKDSSASVGRAQARQMFWSRAATVMMLSSLYALGKGDDEDYAEMDLRTRDNNWILGGGYKLPVPGELGALFKVIPERVVEYMRRQGTPEEQTAWEATRTALTYIFEQYAGRVVPVPQAVKPLLEAWTNYSFLTGRELEGIYQKQQDPSVRRAANTSELAIAIANFSKDVIGVDKVSPILVDNALNGYFGSSAALLVAATDSLLNPTRVDRPLHKWALVSNYMYDPVGTRRMTEFYEEREKVGRANTTLNELMRTDLDRAVKYAEDHADELALESAVNSTLEQLQRTREYRKFLNSPDAAEAMTAEEREADLKEIRKMEVELTGWVREAKAALR